MDQSTREQSMTREIKVDASAGNVFADLGLDDADELLAKAELTRRIAALIRARRLTQAAAARALGIDQPKVSRLLRGHLDEFSGERLMRFLRLLGQDIEIVVRPPRTRRLGYLRVKAA